MKDMILQRNQGNKGIEIFIFQVTHIVLSISNKYGLKYVLKYSLHYIPPAKLSYDLIVQYDVGWLSRVQTL